tara:strand:+ start:5711 stop:7780 length:2070 start_codon:yes stop_codon:yes gene_type:complete
VALTTGLPIEVQDYNDLALEVNRLYSDNTVSLGYYSSNIVLDTTPGTNQPAGTEFILTGQITVDDFIVVTVGDVTLINVTDYTITVDPSGDDSVTIIDPVLAATQIVVYARTTHRYGWGQQASVHPIAVGDPVLSDEATLQAYIESNSNNLIDKLNIIEIRTGGTNEVTRIAVGDLITPTEFVAVQNFIDTDILTGDTYWTNDLAVVTGSVLTYTRTDSWTAKLTATTRFTWDAYDDLRYFLNAGCAMRSALSMTGDASNTGYANWVQVVNEMGTLIVDYNSSSQTGSNGITTNIGAYELTPTFQTIYTSSSPANPVDVAGQPDAYSTFASLTVRWEARLLADTPSAGNVSIDIRAILDDTNFPQFVEGTTTKNSGYTLAEGVVDNSAVYAVTAFTPTLTTQEDFISNGTTFAALFSISGATQANPAVITVSDTTGLLTGEKVRIADVVGMTELNGKCYTVTVIDGTSFSLDGVDSTAFGAYTGSSGSAYRKESLNWILEGASGTDLSLGFTQDTGVINVVYDWTALFSGADTNTSDAAIYVGTGECLESGVSAMTLQGSGIGDGGQSVMTLYFQAEPGVAASQNVNNVEFRISDIDQSNGRDESITVIAYDAANVETAVTITPGANLNVTNQVVSATGGNFNPTDSAASALFQIAGPVARITITFSSDSGGGGAVNMSDVYFEPIALF